MVSLARRTSSGCDSSVSSSRSSRRAPGCPNGSARCSVSADATSPVQTAIQHLALAGVVPSPELTRAFEQVMKGDATSAQIAALLMALRVKGETPEEVAAVVRAMRSVMVRLPAEEPEGLVDTCGTGGGSLVTFNISTAAALLAAGIGVRVAKHGNRSFTSLCGSADVLEALGIMIDVPVPVMEHALRERSEERRVGKE